MQSELTLSELTNLTGLDVLEHLDREVTIPVSGGMQAQGDLIVIPLEIVPNPVGLSPWTRTVTVPSSGVELLRSTVGGNPHSLVADEGTCTWRAPVWDAMGLALGVVENTATAYLLHPEHGAMGLAPGFYVIRRQRELGVDKHRSVLVAD
ncbi:hypothetical protein IEU95_08385 [Hoyosella rhizosphaerae]|uniref:Uncharacterized protein n=1 Tax=Hoyosella rhizosphaerae TaxID=1755582 RepID=A0A916U0V4_9ACTN|nr:hypothetical protein [Hoyosella rhizosphaerae]MBN4926845.1 hypothetical protein [Hoyosella rhizosphaerae]GGC56062.1 hypothetical protein GCM10011410_05590 [Hoyosella rhizosphaerae]